MSKARSLVLASVLALAACASHTPRPAADPAPPPVVSAHTPATIVRSGALADDNLNAVLWSQRAIEHDLVYQQIYRDAQDRLLAALKDKRWDALAKGDRLAPVAGLKPAVVLDIDETVLDNAPYQARLIARGGEYDEADWAAWCRQAAARALPGAVAFTQFAARHGVAVIYISNRASALDQVTLENLRKVGLPVAGPNALLGLGSPIAGCTQGGGSDKSCRRQWVSRTYRVLMQFGDQLADFVAVPSNTDAGREQAIAPYREWIGERWFVLPNPTYGAWESALFDNQPGLSRPQRRQLKLQSLRTE
ncbi:MAG: HAD family acid phosphatase [Dyella sp.]